MRDLTSIELKNAAFLTANDVPYALVEITATQLAKSILDATELFREFVAEYGVHDYESQAFGTDKRLVPTTLIDEHGSAIESKASLYRANGRGDPRLWFSNLSSSVGPGDLVAVVWAEARFWVIGISQSLVEERLGSHASIKSVIGSFVSIKNGVVGELRGLMEAIAKKGFIKAPVVGSTAVGRLLESELGIAMNSKNEPDYKGIEIKSSRGGSNIRVNLFAKTPDWAHSNASGGSKELLGLYGYQREDRRKLYCQIEGHKANSQGLRLRVDESKDSLHVVHEPTNERNVAFWDLETLRFCLSKKHDETFWVKAETRTIAGDEYLRFVGITHTRKPILSQLAPTLSDGTVSLDFTISSDTAGKVHDKGYLFKVMPASLGSLFPPATEYSLPFSEQVSIAK